jgi:hypothetical protein
MNTSRVRIALSFVPVSILSELSRISVEASASRIESPS